MSVAEDPWWQSLFMTQGLQDEIPPKLLAQEAENQASQPTVTPTKRKKQPTDDMSLSPPMLQKAPKRVEQARPATIGRPKLDEPRLKAPKMKQESASKNQEPDVDDQDDLDVHNDDLDLDSEAEDSRLNVLK